MGSAGLGEKVNSRVQNKSAFTGLVRTREERIDSLVVCLLPLRPPRHWIAQCFQVKFVYISPIPIRASKLKGRCGSWGGFKGSLTAWGIRRPPTDPLDTACFLPYRSLYEARFCGGSNPILLAGRELPGRARQVIQVPRIVLVRFYVLRLWDVGAFRACRFFVDFGVSKFDLRLFVWGVWGI